MAAMEYKLVPIHADPAALEKTFNELGRESWVLHEIVRMPDLVAIFTREDRWRGPDVEKVDPTPKSE